MKKIKWAEIMEQNMDQIEEKMLEAFELAESPISGGHVDVEMDRNGHVWTYGPIQQNEQSEGSYKGDVTVVKSIETWQVNCDPYEIVIENLPEYKEIYDSFECFKIDENDKYLSFDDFTEERYPDKLNEWETVTREAEIMNFEADIPDYVEDAIRDQKIYDSYEE